MLATPAGADRSAGVNRTTVALWRLVQWQRIRLERERRYHLEARSVAMSAIGEQYRVMVEACNEEDYWRERCRELEQEIVETNRE
jgi:hypothetical protein